MSVALMPVLSAEVLHGGRDGYNYPTITMETAGGLEAAQLGCCL